MLIISGFRRPPRAACGGRLRSVGVMIPSYRCTLVSRERLPREPFRCRRDLVLGWSAARVAAAFRGTEFHLPPALQTVYDRGPNAIE
jgi:hypothetical protein